MTRQISMERPQRAPANADSCCGKKEPPARRVRECVPCDLDRFCRNNYFTGKLLTARDLTLEQRYLRDKLRLHHRVLHGWGVACGLLVKPHPNCPDLRIIVEPGIAIDRCGYEIVVPEAVEIELPRPPGKRTKPENPCPPDDQAQQSGTDQHAHGAQRESDAYGTTSQYKTSREPCDPPEPCMPLAVCIRYAECEEEFMPAPFDECGCNSADRNQPNRICEGFSIELVFDKPNRIEHCDDDTACADLFKDAFDCCPNPERGDCIPLAFIEEYRRGETVVEQQINNRDYRPVLASTNLLERVLRCLAERAPDKVLTRVQDIGWTHGQEYHCHDFIRWYTGQAESDGALEVTFTAPVRCDAWTRTFQATVVRYSGPSAGLLQLAPARVWQSPDRRQCYLQIDRAWVEQELPNVAFDVYLTLRCGLVVDDQGQPVDGDLLARVVQGDRYLVAPPTGNGVPGGSLESWITVLP